MNYSNTSCSFCGKDKTFVKILIAGPEYTLGKKERTTRAYICNECVETCIEVLADHKDDPEPEKLHCDDNG